MKRVPLWTLVLASSLVRVSAQISVEVTLEQEQFLPGESLPVAVRITNRSGQTLHLGAEPDWISFSVEGRDGRVMPHTGRVRVQGEFALDSAKVATKRADLAPCYSLTSPGRYSVAATVRIPGWNRELKSTSKTFYVVEGARLWEQEFGVPAAAGDTNTIPEVRKYILQQANYLQGEIRLYLRLTDAAGTKVFRVHPIGKMVSFSRPDFEVDKLSNLHVLYQSWARSYSYTMFNPQGDVLAQEVYDYVTTRPRLQKAGDGTISVAGGVRRLKADDTEQR